MNAVYEISTGLVRRFVECPEEDMQINLGDGEAYVQSDNIIWGPAQVVDGAVVPAPESVDIVKLRKLSEIEEARRRKTEAPIAYEGAMLDADKTAQANISAKLQEIAQRLGMGISMPAELMVWRDYDNSNHVFATLVEYQSWLGRLAIAITERGTLLYGWSWQMKALVAAAETAAEVEAITIA
jgi:hypothetical protein